MFTILRGGRAYFVGEVGAGGAEGSIETEAGSRNGSTFLVGALWPPSGIISFEEVALRINDKCGVGFALLGPEGHNHGLIAWRHSASKGVVSPVVSCNGATAG